MILEHCDVCCTMTESERFSRRCKQCRTPRRDPKPRDGQWQGVAQPAGGDGRALGFYGVRIT